MNAAPTRACCSATVRNNYGLTVIGLTKTIDSDVYPIRESLGAWAALALLLGLDPVKPLAPPPKARALIAA